MATGSRVSWSRLLLVVIAVCTAAGQSLPGCPSKCGDVEVPYPFGVSRNCSRDETFVLTCNRTSNGTGPFGLYTAGGLPVFSVSILHGTLDAFLFFIRACYDGKTKAIVTVEHELEVKPPLSISHDRNRFIATGCNVDFSYYDTPDDDNLWTGCYSGCGNLASVVNNSCSGFGCCESTLPRGITYIYLYLESDKDQIKTFTFNPCNYAFIIDRDKFVFNTSWITVNYSYQEPPQVPAVLDWSIHGADCRSASTTGGGGGNSSAVSTYACVSANSECVDSHNGVGYLCNCSAGYAGNPYLQEGCQDIDECQLDRKLYPCYGNCINTPGSYSCSCPTGTTSGDPKKFLCVKSPGLSLASKLLIGVGSGILCLSLIVSISILIFQKRKLRQHRKQFFQQNGGVFLQQKIQSHQQSSFKIFTMAEIEKATNNFNKNFVLGKGGFGTVYKGILDDGRVIAVKKSITIEERHNQEFAKELFILSQINHKNIVKLLGCCLEYEVPMLVYEYICNGTLFNYIHKKKHESRIPFGFRLKIAIESAEALRYLHTDASPSILHGDVKSSNILLDENFMPKVSDFGASIFAPKDKAQFTTFVQGTCGYLDPEYMQTSQLTDKSDVYSFGVVLLEILTGKLPFHFEGIEEERNLVSWFIFKMKENKLIDILHQDIIEEGALEDSIVFADLVGRCLNLTGNGRPSMKEVVSTLERLYELKHQINEEQKIGVKRSMEGKQSFNLDVVDEVTKEEHVYLLKVEGRY